MTSVLVTGATGFLGEHVMQRVLGAQSPFDKVIAFARPTSDVAALQASGVEIRQGDLGDAASLTKALQDVDVLINIASLGFGQAPEIVRAVQESATRRAIFISTTAIFTHLPARTKSVRLAAEKLIQESGLDYTILRPTMIYGTPKDRNIWRFIQYLRRFPAMPVVGDGSCLQQPVHVEDVADAVMQSLFVQDTYGKAFDVAGAAPLSFVEMIDTVSRLLQRRTRKIHLPLTAMVWGARLSRLIPVGPSISDEQILRLNEDKAFSIANARKTFHYDPMSFEVGVKRELSFLS